MLDQNSINRLIEKATLASFGGRKLSRVLSEPASDSDGRDALLVTIVLNSGHEISGDTALNTIVGIQRELQKSGDGRFPIVDFVTEDEMESDGSSES